jgi:hypothetical protein
MSSGAQPPEGQSGDSGRQGRATVNATVFPPVIRIDERVSAPAQVGP